MDKGPTICKVELNFQYFAWSRYFKVIHAVFMFNILIIWKFLYSQLGTLKLRKIYMRKSP